MTPATERRLSRIFNAPRAAPPSRSLLAGQRALAPDLNQSCVLLRFSEPLPRGLCGHFLRVHLASEGAWREVNKKAEAAPYMVRIFQPDRVGPQYCPGELVNGGDCGQLVERINLEYTRCNNPQCKLFNRRIASGPVRGVVDVLITPEMIVETDAGGVQWVSGCVLVLDRRYSETILADVYRNAAALAEFLGAKVA